MKKIPELNINIRGRFGTHRIKDERLLSAVLRHDNAVKAAKRQWQDTPLGESQTGWLFGMYPSIQRLYACTDKCGSPLVWSADPTEIMQYLLDTDPAAYWRLRVALGTAKTVTGEVTEEVTLSKSVTTFVEIDENGEALTVDEEAIREAAYQENLQDCSHMHGWDVHGSEVPNVEVLDNGRSAIGGAVVYDDLKPVNICGPNTTALYGDQ